VKADLLLEAVSPKSSFAVNFHFSCNYLFVLVYFVEESLFIFGFSAAYGAWSKRQALESRFGVFAC